MKKMLSILSLVGVIGIGSFAFASDGEIENRFDGKFTNNPNYEETMQKRREYMMESKREDLKEALKNGEISQEEAKKWEDHYNYMDKFHSENGFGGCHGRGRGGMGRGNRN
ncbi:hypothetical protein [Tissierella creatinophila]|uniref:DUF2680 domain-containing protein n=1 Tax=Tissierella creatinophila DSM 6911 TaxID=1123403 RepID=A0A1U7M8P5_TISCR|nr:hypothetical protein [Tissierella creatinophila]OLS03656.1 hypothetical protein TICRE_03520 [Tissierella creatinophila DSM 6911]